MEREHDMREREITIEAGGPRLTGDLVVPPRATGVVLFAHGSGSSRKSARNRAVARVLAEAGMATLLLDLLTPLEEEREQAGALLRFDVQRLASRLEFAIGWLGRHEATRDLPLGLFGASTGAASALIAATERPARVSAVVSRGGRPDLAEGALERVRCPTLLIAGGDDDVVLDLNRSALRRLTCIKRLVVVPGATHLFEERGALEQVASLAREWFALYLRPTERPAVGGGEVEKRSMGFRAPFMCSFADQDPPSRRSQPEIVAPQHEPVPRRPDEEPIRVEPLTVPSTPDPRPAPIAPEVQPYRERR